MTSELIESLNRLAVGFYILLLISFGSVAYGLYRYHQRKAVKKQSGLLSIIAQTTWNNKSRKIFVVTFIAYGMFFSLTSGLIVYQPDVVFSYHYNAIVPSTHINACCGEPGYMPEIIVASTFFAIFVGSSSVVAFTVLLTQLQTLFIGITIPILLVTPLIIARKIQTQNNKCA